MSDPFYGEIRTFGFPFAPVHWAHCNGQIMEIMQNQALYSLLGTYFGGNGTTTFGLPNLQGRVPMHYGTGTGLTTRPFAQSYGFETTTLTTNNLPDHNHDFNISDSAGDTYIGNGSALAQYALDTQTGQPARFLETYDTEPTFQSGYKLVPQTISNTGGGQAFNNMQPYLALNFCIALDGLYPSRS